MLNREFSLRGPESLLTCHSAWHSSYSPGSSGWSFYLLQSGGKMLEYLSIWVKSLWFPSISAQRPGKVSALDRPTQHLIGSLVGRKKKNLCKERSRNVFTNLYSSWNYSSSAVPLTDRGNTAERIYVSTYQDGELLGFVPSECGAFTVCTACQEMWVDGRFGRLHFNLCKNHFTAWFETWWVEGEGPHITVYKLANWEALRRKIEQRRMNSCQNVIHFEVSVEACAAFLLVKSILSNHWCTQPTIVIFTCYFW